MSMSEPIGATGAEYIALLLAVRGCLWSRSRASPRSDNSTAACRQDIANNSRVTLAFVLPLPTARCPAHACRIWCP